MRMTKEQIADANKKDLKNNLKELASDFDISLYKVTQYYNLLGNDYQSLVSKLDSESLYNPHVGGA
jgi:hypothetical protein